MEISFTSTQRNAIESIGFQHAIDGYDANKPFTLPEVPSLFEQANGSLINRKIVQNTHGEHSQLKLITQAGGYAAFAVKNHSYIHPETNESILYPYSLWLIGSDHTIHVFTGDMPTQTVDAITETPEQYGLDHEAAAKIITDYLNAEVDLNSPTHLTYLMYFISSYAKDDVKALEIAQFFGKKQGNERLLIAAANIVMHRAKQHGLGIKLYDHVLETSQNPATLQEAADNKWRMIHHHPRFEIPGYPQEERAVAALEIVESIKVENPYYSSPELAILHDFTRADFEKALEEYLKVYDNLISKGANNEMADQSEFWFFNPYNIAFLAGTLMCKLQGASITSDNIQNNDFLKGLAVELELIDKEGTVLNEDNLNTFCNYANFVNDLREGAGKLSLDAIFQEEATTIMKFEDLLIACAQKLSKGETLSQIADLIAPSRPEDALALYNHAATQYGYSDAEYAVGDFKLEPTADFPVYTLKDFVS